MAVNWFEGGRRITGLLQASVALVGAFYVLFGSSGNAVVFETRSPDQNFQLTFEPCRYPDLTRNIGYKVELRRGDARDIELCFRQDINGILYRDYPAPVVVMPPPLTMRGEPPRPPQPPPRYFLAGAAFSPEVQAYVDERVDVFRHARYEWESIARDSLLQGKLWRIWYRLKEAWPWVFGLAFGLWIFASTIGWIIRGFAGIPSGKDFRAHPVE